MRYITVLLVFIVMACTKDVPVQAEESGRMVPMTQAGERSLVLGGGCFWCLEAAYELVPGVIDVESGYAGGTRDKPSYEQVSAGSTGHAEVVKIRYDPAIVTLETLFELFYHVHDPTTKDRQGADVGTQYRSIILYSDEEQKQAAVKVMKSEQARFSKPIVPQLESLGAYWPAEEYHQDFYRNNPNYGYCLAVVVPKVDKAKNFVDKLVPLKP